MTRLPFRIPEFEPRIVWASARAREVWQSRVSAVSQAWIRAERESVYTGVRPSALQHVSPEALPDVVAEAAARGAVALPLKRVAKVAGYRSAGGGDLQAGQAFDYLVAISDHYAAPRWASALGDDDEIGMLLGTPDCCRSFFNEMWSKQRWMDTTWPMHAFRPKEGGWGTPMPEIEGPINMLLRWLGIRPVSHLPCSTTCKESIILAQQLSILLPEPERTWHMQIMSWPVKWTSLQGIAEITTPILRMSVPTDATETRLEVRYVGRSYPAEGASGLEFPFQRGTIAQPLRFVRNTQQPSDNGFASVAAQYNHHRVLVEKANNLSYLNQNLKQWFTVVDLGCGDGTLLMRFNAQHRVGVERDSGVALKAMDRGVNVTVADCTDQRVVDSVLAAWKPDLVIAQRDRNPPETLKGYRVLSYSYEEGAAGPELIEPR